MRSVDHGWLETRPPGNSIQELDIQVAGSLSLLVSPQSDYTYGQSKTRKPCPSPL